jgi:hypothetical protein
MAFPRWVRSISSKAGLDDVEKRERGSLIAGRYPKYDDMVSSHSNTLEDEHAVSYDMETPSS